MSKRTITITFNPDTPCGFDVIEGDRMADNLTYEEMLGLVATLTMPERRPSLAWMKTPEQRQAWADRMKEVGSNRELMA